MVVGLTQFSFNLDKNSEVVIDLYIPQLIDGTAVTKVSSLTYLGAATDNDLTSIIATSKEKKPPLSPQTQEKQPLHQTPPHWKHSDLWLYYQVWLLQFLTDWLRQPESHWCSTPLTELDQQQCISGMTSIIMDHHGPPLPPEVIRAEIQHKL